MLDALCEHGKSDGCSSVERYYISMPYARSDMAISFWQSRAVPRIDKLRWLKEPLEGLATLHSMGIIHRDIRLKNMLIMSVSPPRASICDYGKAVEAESASSTGIGPILTCAPEVWRVPNFGPYSNKIDTWAFGYAIADVLGYSVENNPGADGFRADNPKITRNRLAAIVQMLLGHSERYAEDAALVDLALKLLKWDPKERWSAEQALGHECWAPILQETRDNEQGREAAREQQQSQAKRVRVKTSSRLSSPGSKFTMQQSESRLYRRTNASIVDVPAPLQDTVPTREASEETKALMARQYPTNTR